MSKPPASRNKPRWHPSPNHGERRDGLRPSLIVIHYTAMSSAEAALERMCAPEHEVSAHYLIARDGEVVQLVEEDRRAWHAGAGQWAGAGDVNSRSIGIELDNSGDVPFSEPLMSALTALVAAIRGRWDIPREGVIAHSDFAPERKADPGARFDWRRLALSGQAVWPEPGSDVDDVSDDAFLSALERFGYPADAGTQCLLTAFRLRFRPWAQGPLDATDVALAKDLAARFGVDRTHPSA
ncbi:N-acetylmuramoyl-L-alanine amidase [Maritimibacter dapengensis]|uniref:N-acetylmuramoyl-L-alanine amidase n=1 Tax=Maritimibacter dapengensis TaxID=2836868 RepID=A0ABS6T096_9RHOB|nr:N-acetylmuramoyl-L-alanine amidase [Maritimibacter dapengensis]MBV7378654.1 N-acetylmuramoyl-L-alanine amidase [Maritimibacter dapengensis]